MTTRLQNTIVVLFVSIVSVAGGLWFMRAYPPSNLFVDDHAKSAIVEGATLPVLDGYAWKSHHTSIVLALHVGCQYCRASMGFYERLNKMEKRGEFDAHILAVFNDDADKLEGEFPKSLHQLQKIADVDLLGIGVRATPTILLVDSKGIARRIWSGMLSPELENQVLAAVRRTD